MFEYITVFDPSRSHGEDDIHQQLLLYHSFTGSENSLNDKLGQIGVIQGLWSLTNSLSGEDGNQGSQEKVVQLHGKVLLIIRVESRFFICLSMNKDDNSIHHQFYLAHLWHCYRFFTLWHNKFASIPDARRLTNLLNEHFVPFWCDLQVKPDAIIKKGIVGLWHQSHKMAELEFAHCDQSWESLINQDVLLESESYLGIKDILVYHLPNFEQSPGYKTYGLVRNFSSDIDFVTNISNWIYHSHALYGNLSSHVLASNTHYKETPADNTTTATASSNIRTQARTVVPALTTTGETILHNLTLPISLAYDAVQEVGATTGISNSISLFMDYLPKWNPSAITSVLGGNPREQGPAAGPPQGYLISPLCGNGLPENYKQRVVKSQAGTINEKDYNCIFWYYRDVLVCVVSEPNFNKIQDHQYLEDLSYKLSCSMEKFYATAFPKEKHGQQQPQPQPQLPPPPPTIQSRKKFDSFGFALRDKRTNECRCSIPSWPLNNESRSYHYGTFLDSMPQDKLWELQHELVQFLQSLQNSRREKDSATEERLTRLSNGLVCFIRDCPEEMALVVANWFDETSHGGPTLISGLGPSAIRWWNQRSPPG
ncbi:hypothetical protein ZYGR_0I07270 [Zygosaccharomyces rouxii]|uniref:ZYRO0C17160p n=2 Tax=Zygosaccharomyces rouxii TaxID=4956 RepID=C5DUJ1_ZYGRC|nr:uncharacterized protein ZYRO0C17160g [Zygosaccharomyces rouxii]KAH9201377.1 hypothetical protein LQ764DRAFT_78575 [Zygosaccharomyces rouxii]GAV48430.1 hypothetical protein ZYGR_0I07270 [Zygosaccharomyces rouxii]CAR27452.1 ZYRO0C17160p [Zygosaccharomyces rouxii]